MDLLCVMHTLDEREPTVSAIMVVGGLSLCGPCALAAALELTEGRSVLQILQSGREQTWFTDDEE